MFLAFKKLSLIIISVGPVESASSMVDSIFDAALISRATTGVYFGMLIFLDVVVVVALVDVSCAVDISAVAVLLAIYKVTSELLSQVDQFEFALSVEDALLEKSIVICNE